MDKPSIFAQARAILLHPNFNKLNLEQMNNVYLSLLASGLTKDDIANIILQREPQPENIDRSKINLLEKLPRDVFKHMVEVGEISGKDLINLCNSSPKLRVYCLADKVGGVNGQIIQKQEIYSLALEKMGIKILPKDDPASLYSKLSSGMQLWFSTEEMSKPFAYPEMNNVVKISKSYNSNTVFIFILTSDGNIDVLIFENNGFRRKSVYNKGNIKDITTVENNYRLNLIFALDNNGQLIFIKEIPIPGSPGEYGYSEERIPINFIWNTFHIRNKNEIRNRMRQVKFKRLFAQGYFLGLITENDDLYYMWNLNRRERIEFTSILVYENVKLVTFTDSYPIYVTKDNRIFHDAITGDNGKSKILEIPNTMGDITKLAYFNERIFFSTSDGNIFMMSTENYDTIPAYIARNVGFHENLNDFALVPVMSGMRTNSVLIYVITNRILKVYEVVISNSWQYGEVMGGERIINITNPLFVFPFISDPVFVLSIPE